AARIKSALRLRNLRDEARLRSESFGGEADMTGAPSLPSAPRAISGRTEDEAAAPMSILAIGAPSRHFLAARAALEARSVNVVAAVSAGTAFDFLERDPFDAALAFIDDEAAQTLNICAVMRRNPRLYDTPVLAVAGPDCCEDFNQMYTRGVSDIVETPIDAEDFADRALAHAQRFRRVVGLRRFLQDTRPARTLDAESGLFNSSFFGRHFSRLTTHAQKTGRPLSLAAFRLRDFNEVVAADGTEAAEMLLRQASETARLLVRAEDFAARLGQDTFLIAMPSTSTEDGGVAVRRICGMLAHTRFKRRLNDRGGTISLNYGLVAHNADDPIERTVATALATLKANAA
ncbi:MAG: diguanylate cyclase, partial [Pseudomonadota bacterium]